jgi:hypothetical protein
MAVADQRASTFLGLALARSAPSADADADAAKSESSLIEPSEVRKTV